VRDQLREIRDGLDVTRLRDVDETVRVQVVAEKEGGVPVLGREQPRAPEMDEAVIWDRVVATATVDGMPVKTNKGVIRKPPPTPNMPERKPTPVPSKMMNSQLTDISATGR